MTTTPEQDKRQKGIKVIVRFFDAFNKRDTATMMSLLAHEHIDHTYFGRSSVSPEAVGRAIMGMFDTFPDWHETIDEIIPKEDGETFVVRQTGRGTQRKTYMGHEPPGHQIAASLITVLKIRDGKITEYRSTFPFTRPWDETITAAEDLDDARAEQGGMRISQPQWTQALRDYAEGEITEADLMARKQDLSIETSRCQALLAASMRRCQNRAMEGSLYCEIHQEPGEGGGFGPA